MQLQRFEQPPLHSAFLTGNFARSARRRYLIHSEADFEVFRLAGATRAPMGVKFGISPPSVQRLGYRTPKTEIFTEI